MKGLRRLEILLLTAACAVFGACRNQSINQQTTNSNLAVTQEKPAGGEASVGERSYFRGTSAAGSNSLKIEMTLVRDGERATGRDFYPKVGKNIELKWTMDKEGNVELRAEDASGKETAVVN